MHEHALPALRHQHINERIYELILSRILSQQFSPGERLRVNEIAEALGVSRTPVKDAINRLAVEGLIVVSPRKGTFVADITADGIKDLFDVRLMMELHAAELAVHRATQEDVAELQRELEGMSQYVEGERYLDFESFLVLDTEFHLKFFRIAGNRLLLKLYQDINLHLQVVRAYQKAPGAATEAGCSLREHTRIVAALQAADTPALRDAIREHVIQRQKLFSSALEAAGPPEEQNA